jgi:hypothetical protein
VGIPHSSGSWEDQGAEDLVSSEGLLPGLQMSTFLLYPNMVEREH